MHSAPPPVDGYAGTHGCLPSAGSHRRRYTALAAHGAAQRVAVQHLPTEGSCPVRTTGRPLMLERCRRCAILLAPLTASCSRCGSTHLDAVPSTGTGSVVSSRVVHRASNGPRGALVPYTIAIVALDDGPWVYTSIDGPLPEHPDDPIRVEFRPTPPGKRFPVFTVRQA